MENPAWTKDAKFSTAQVRKENEKELAKLIEEWTVNHAPEQVLMALTQGGMMAAMSDEVAGGRLPTGIYEPGKNPPGTYRCLNEERWCAISVFTDDEWQSFCKIIGNPALAENPKFATLIARKENEEELDRIVNEWTISRKAEEVMTLMQEGGVAAGLLETGEDQIEHDPQTKHRNTFPELDHPTLGKHYAVSSPFIMSKTPAELVRAPLLGEHNEYVFKEILGMTDDEIAELAISGALE